MYYETITLPGETFVIVFFYVEIEWLIQLFDDK